MAEFTNFVGGNSKTVSDHNVEDRNMAEITNFVGGNSKTVFDHNVDVINTLDQWIRRGKAIDVEEAEDNKYIKPMRWRGKELVKAVGVNSQQVITNAENDKRLPGFRELRVKENGYTLDMVNKAREVFGTLFVRDPDDPPFFLALSNFKGGCYKSTTIHELAACAATEGLKVLVCDADPQATLTSLFGFVPNGDILAEDTITSLLMRSNNDAEVKVDEVRALIKDTNISTLKLLPACLALYELEIELGAQLYERPDIDFNEDDDQQTLDMKAEMYDREFQRNQVDVYSRLRNILNLVADDFDVIIMDSTPSLSALPLSVMFASDAVVVPVPTEKPDWLATNSFFEMLSRRYKKTLKIVGNDIRFPDFKILATRFSPGAYTHGSKWILEDFIRAQYGKGLLGEVVKKHESAIGQASLASRSMFDVNTGVLNVRKDAQIKCMENYQAVWDEIKRDVIFPKWPNTKKAYDFKRELLL